MRRRGAGPPGITNLRYDHVHFVPVLATKIRDRSCRRGTEAGMKAVIIGGGIGGLASAVALARRGWQVEVLERAPEFTEVGAGLSVWANGLRALDALGVGEAVRQHVALEGQGGIQDNTGR